MNQTELAKKIGIDPAHFSMILSGKREIGKKAALKIHLHSDIPVAALLYGKTEDVKQSLVAVYGEISDGRGR